MECEEIFIEEKIIAYLLILGINPSLKGFSYFKEGVKKIIKDPAKKFNVHKKLYKELSEGNGRDELVDRAMRHAIEVSVKKNGIIEFEKRSHVCFSSLRPTPREFLSLLAETVMLDVREFRSSNSKILKYWQDEIGGIEK